jgi:folate-binding protein YgfZ
MPDSVLLCSALRTVILRIPHFFRNGDFSLYSLMLVSGSDALDFLQGQFTQDVAGLTKGECLPAAWCNPQGRVLMTLRLLRSDDAFVLTVADAMAETAIARLQMYRLRSKVEFSLNPPAWQAFATPGLRDSRQAAVGNWYLPIPGETDFTEVIALRDSPNGASPDALQKLDSADWQAARISAGRVDITSTNSGLYTPHMLNLDRSGAVSFRKGCYAGQEIVARTENLGRSKRRTLRFSCDAEGLAIGDILLDGDTGVGTVVNAFGTECLAVISLDVADKALSIRGCRAIRQPLPYEPG